MPLKTEGLDEPEINLTPMIDVVFQLILFFLLGTEFAEKNMGKADEESAALPIQLPTSSVGTSLTPGPDPLVVSITKAGELYLNTEPVTLPALEEKLKAAKENYDDTAVIIAGDGQAYLQIVVDVLQTCERLKIKEAKVKTKKVPPPPM
jgi:biopolymer transport protein ExbD